MRHDQGTLPLTDGCDDVNHPSGNVLIAPHIAFHAHLHFGENGREVFKHHLVLIAFRCAAIHFFELVQGKVTLTVLGGTHFTFNHVARVEIKTADLAGADVNVVGAGGVTGIGAAEETKTIRQNFQHAVGDDLLSGTGAFFDDGKHQLLLAHPTGIFNIKFFCLFQDFGNVQCFEFV